jgi:hypothetical protein
VTRGGDDGEIVQRIRKEREEERGEEEMGRIFADVTIDRAERVGPSRYLKR